MKNPSATALCRRSGAAPNRRVLRPRIGKIAYFPSRALPPSGARDGCPARVLPAVMTEAEYLRYFENKLRIERESGKSQHKAEPAKTVASTAASLMTEAEYLSYFENKLRIERENGTNKLITGVCFAPTTTIADFASKSKDVVAEKVVNGGTNVGPPPSKAVAEKSKHNKKVPQKTIQGLALDCVQLEMNGLGPVHFMLDNGNVFNLPPQVTVNSKKLYRFNGLVIVDNELQELYTDNMGSVFRRSVKAESCPWEFFAFFEKLAVSLFTTGKEVQWFYPVARLPEKVQTSTITTATATQTTDVEDDSGLGESLLRSISPFEHADDDSYFSTQLLFVPR